ncbi:MAG: OmpA family protein [Bacteroidia bacterium]
MKKILIPVLMIVALANLSSCVTKKKFNSQVAKYDSLKIDNEKNKTLLASCLNDKDRQANRVTTLEAELAETKARSNAMLNQLSDLSVISKEQSESIKKSLENISSKDAYIKDLHVAMARKDSLNMALIMNLKGSLKDVNDEDVNVRVEGSAVFINISDKMLFKSGSYDIMPRAKEVLGKVADVLKGQPDMQFMVEGHTDNKPIKTATIKDNWDLSALRANAVVRVLQKDYKVDPSRMISAARSEYVSIAPNDTPEGRATNRRTRIVILPQLDQFFKLLEPKK